MIREPVVIVTRIDYYNIDNLLLLLLYIIVIDRLLDWPI